MYWSQLAGVVKHNKPVQSDQLSMFTTEVSPGRFIQIFIGIPNLLSNAYFYVLTLTIVLQITQLNGQDGYNKPREFSHTI